MERQTGKEKVQLRARQIENARDPKETASVQGRRTKKIQSGFSNTKGMEEV